MVDLFESRDPNAGKQGGAVDPHARTRRSWKSDDIEVPTINNFVMVCVFEARHKGRSMGGSRTIVVVEGRLHEAWLRRGYPQGLGGVRESEAEQILGPVADLLFPERRPHNQGGACVGVESRHRPSTTAKRAANVTVKDRTVRGMVASGFSRVLLSFTDHILNFEILRVQRGILLPRSYPFF